MVKVGGSKKLKTGRKIFSMANCLQYRNTQVIELRQANWIGHVLRHDCLLKTVLEGKIERKRPRGKPRRKMLDLLMEQEENKISYDELKRGAQSRVGWRHRHWNLP